MTNTAKRLGYGGSGEVDGKQVLITSGSLEQTNTPSFLEMYDISPTGSPMDSRSKVIHADGVSVSSGSISFDMTTAVLGVFTTGKLLARGYKFNIGIHDGESSWQLQDCYVTNLSLSGAASGLIGASVSVMSKKLRSSGGVVNDYILETASGGGTNVPFGYWWSGGTDVREWTLTMNQAVEPVYVNENISSPTPDPPRYMKIGLIEYTLDVGLYSDLTPSTITISSSSFTLTGRTGVKGYSFAGLTDLGMYTHSFITGADASTGSGAVIIT